MKTEGKKMVSQFLVSVRGNFYVVKPGACARGRVRCVECAGKGSIIGKYAKEDCEKCEGEGHIDYGNSPELCWVGDGDVIVGFADEIDWVLDINTIMEKMI